MYVCMFVCRYMCLSRVSDVLIYPEKVGIQDSVWILLHPEHNVLRMTSLTSKEWEQHAVFLLILLISLRNSYSNAKLEPKPYPCVYDFVSLMPNNKHTYIHT